MDVFVGSLFRLLQAPETEGSRAALPLQENVGVLNLPLCRGHLGLSVPLCKLERMISIECLSIYIFKVLLSSERYLVQNGYYNIIL